MTRGSRIVTYCCMKCTDHPNFRANGSKQYFKTFISQCCFSVRYTVTDLLAGFSQAKYISITNVIIIMSAFYIICMKVKFSVHNGMRGSRTFCKLCTAGQMNWGAQGCEFVITQPTVGLLPKLGMFSVYRFQCMCRW